MSNWTLFSNHGHVLVCLANNSEARLRDVAADVGITERAVQKIVRDLQTNGMISVTKHGRRNRYRIHYKKTLRHDLEAHCTLGDLMKVVSGGKPDKVKLKRDRTIESLSDLVKPVQTEPFVAEPVQEEPVALEPESAQAESPQVEDKQSEQSAVEGLEAESDKTVAPESIERQQGSLF
jgi:Mn-dependent DtxR family transcriptional regulator